MKRKIFTCLTLALFLLVGCAPSIIIRPDKTIEIKGYHSVVQKDGGISLTAKPIISVGFLDSAVKLAGTLVQEVIKVNPTPTPAPSPVVPPAPVPSPTPVPPTPVPTPAPGPVVTTTLTLFDLPQTAIAMNVAGFPGREGVVLYALGQMANGWPIPGQSAELIAIDAYYNQIQAWYDAQVTAVESRLKADPGLTVTIIGNDAKDRFGCRIGPPTAARLQGFGSRIQTGIIIPESSY